MSDLKINEWEYLENKVAKLVMQPKQAFDHLMRFKLDKVNYYTHHMIHTRDYLHYYAP